MDGAVHDLPKARVLVRLRRFATVVQTDPLQTRYDFLLDHRVRVALRTALASSYRRSVRVGGRRYAYTYRAWNFNFHHRKQIRDRYCDFFVCVPLTGRRVDLNAAYVIPWEARSGKTFYLPASWRPYGGKYAPYRNAWELLRSSRRTATPRLDGEDTRAADLGA